MRELCMISAMICVVLKNHEIPRRIIFSVKIHVVNYFFLL